MKKITLSILILFQSVIVLSQEIIPHEEPKEPEGLYIVKILQLIFVIIVVALLYSVSKMKGKGGGKRIE